MPTTWTAPRSYTPGELMTASIGNTHIRDNLLALRETPFYRCVAYHNTTQTITASATTALSLNSEDVDTATMHDNTTNNSRITMPSSSVAGFYKVRGQTDVSSASNCGARIAIRKGGSTELARASYGTAAATLPTLTMVVLWEGVLANSDYLELVMTETTGNGSLTVGSATAGSATRFGVVGPLPPS